MTNPWDVKGLLNYTGYSAGYAGYPRNLATGQDQETTLYKSDIDQKNLHRQLNTQTIYSQEKFSEVSGSKTQKQLHSNQNQFKNLSNKSPMQFNEPYNKPTGVPPSQYSHAVYQQGSSQPLSQPRQLLSHSNVPLNQPTQIYDPQNLTSSLLSLPYQAPYGTSRHSAMTNKEIKTGFISNSNSRNQPIPQKKLNHQKTVPLINKPEISSAKNRESSIRSYQMQIREMRQKIIAFSKQEGLQSKEDKKKAEIYIKQLEFMHEQIEKEFSYYSDKTAKALPVVDEFLLRLKEQKIAQRQNSDQKKQREVQRQRQRQSQMQRQRQRQREKQKEKEQEKERERQRHRHRQQQKTLSSPERIKPSQTQGASETGSTLQHKNKQILRRIEEHIQHIEEAMTFDDIISQSNMIFLSDDLLKLKSQRERFLRANKRQLFDQNGSLYLLVPHMKIKIQQHIELERQAQLKIQAQRQQQNHLKAKQPQQRDYEAMNCQTKIKSSKIPQKIIVLTKKIERYIKTLSNIQEYPEYFDTYQMTELKNFLVNLKRQKNQLESSDYSDLTESQLVFNYIDSLAAKINQNIMQEGLRCAEDPMQSKKKNYYNENDAQRNQYQQKSGFHAQPQLKLFKNQKPHPNEKIYREMTQNLLLCMQRINALKVYPDLLRDSNVTFLEAELKKLQRKKDSLQRYYASDPNLFIDRCASDAVMYLEDTDLFVSCMEKKINNMLAERPADSLSKVKSSPKTIEMVSKIQQQRQPQNSTKMIQLVKSQKQALQPPRSLKRFDKIDCVEFYADKSPSQPRPPFPRFITTFLQSNRNKYQIKEQTTYDSANLLMIVGEMLLNILRESPQYRPQNSVFF